jgi:CheY-like chemotaxis protein
MKLLVRLAIGTAASLVGLGLLHAQVPGKSAVDPYTSEFERSPPEVGFAVREFRQRQMRELQEQHALRIAIPDAVKNDVPLASNAGVSDHSEGDDAETPAPAITPEGRRTGLLLDALAMVAGLAVVYRFGPGVLHALNYRLNTVPLRPARVAECRANILAEDKAVAEFFANFRTGPILAASTEADSHAMSQALVDFFVSAGEDLLGLNAALRNADSKAGWGARQSMLHEVQLRIYSLKEKATLPEVLPVWQMASALEGLVDQLIERTSSVTASTLRTLSQGVGLLGDLCQPGLDPSLVGASHFRFLVVADDPVSRNALSLALKKSLNPPDLAEDGRKGLAYATTQPYEAILLDIQTPGMDGFEVCSQIHDTGANRATPVIFVTSQNDFESRAKSLLTGGYELIGKPFLTFEVAVKALTLATRGRLQKTASIASSSEVSPPSRPAPMPTPNPRPSLSDDENEPLPVARTRVAWQDGFADPTARGTVPEALLERPVPMSDGAAPADTTTMKLADVFFAGVPERLEKLRELVSTLNASVEPEVRHEVLSDLFLQLHYLGLNPRIHELQAAARVSSGLAGLLKKLLENPSNATPSVLSTVTAATALLRELCVRGLSPDFATNPPIRIMVVDDDPVTRRTISGLLQVAFERPVTAQDAEAAITLAAQTPFDLIFLDVVMPGMDGVTACSRIHETSANSHTPIIFLLGQADMKSRSKAALSGRDDVLMKPFVPFEIALKALVFALDGRLRKFNAETMLSPSSAGSGKMAIENPGRSNIEAVEKFWVGET